jgi:hypothetical protein
MATARFITLVNGIQTEVVPATTSAGSATAGQIIALNAAGQLDSTMLPAGTGLDTTSAITSAAISAGQMVNLYSNAGVLTARPADSTTTGSEANAYSLAAVGSGATGTFYLAGNVTGMSGLTLGTTYFLSTVGAVTTTPPSTAGNIVQIVGKALSATSLAFAPQHYTVLA